MTRIFYVDAAKAKNNKNYWKCSVVENQENVVNFYNGKAKCSGEAEAFVILKTIFWLVEQKYQGEVIIYSDCSSLTGYQSMKKIATGIRKKEGEKSKKYTRKKKIKNRTSEFLLLAKAIAWRNNLNLKIRWVKGKKNPADYYSRHN